MEPRTAALLSLLVAGCLDGGGGEDPSATVDMGSPIDFSGVDFLGVYNCSQLNACEQLCKNLMCVAACRQMEQPERGHQGSRAAELLNSSAAGDGPGPRFARPIHYRRAPAAG